MADRRLKHASEILKEGSEVYVKVMGFDDRGKVRLVDEGHRPEDRQGNRGGPSRPPNSPRVNQRNAPHAKGRPRGGLTVFWCRLMIEGLDLLPGGFAATLSPQARLGELAV